MGVNAITTISLTFTESVFIPKFRCRGYILCVSKFVLQVIRVWNTGFFCEVHSLGTAFVQHFPISCCSCQQLAVPPKSVIARFFFVIKASSATVTSFCCCCIKCQESNRCVNGVGNMFFLIFRVTVCCGYFFFLPPPTLSSRCALAAFSFAIRSSCLFFSASSLCFRMIASLARSALASSVFPSACSFW